MNIEAEKYDNIPKGNVYFHSIQTCQKAYEKINNFLLQFPLEKKKH